ncbi:MULTISPECIES: MFS transporter [Pseudomonas]|uniref:MFS transporter n=1 Tax=Pseudomonas sp. TaxID=306 RepID=UPI00289B0D43|nr:MULTISPECIES: MFS transporter [Pseudomonas]
MNASESVAITLRIASIVVFSFLTFLAIGLPLAILPGYVHDTLGFGSVMAGLTISIQYIATLFTRPIAGKIADSIGPKKGVIAGLFGCGICGILTLISTLLQDFQVASLVLLIIGRVFLGCAQALIGTGSLSWGMGSVGMQHVSKVISWNGIAAYGALAIGAPLGVAMVSSLGLWSLGVSIVLLAAIGLALAWNKEPAPVIPGERLPFLRVFWRISPYGLGLLLSSIGFGTIATFITLYYGSHGWPNAAYSLTAFGAAFICARLLFAGTVNRFGGYPVAIACFIVETLGLLLLWLAVSPGMAMAGAALAGFGLSLVYPALGVEAIVKVPATNRSAALGAYSLCLDMSLGITGPVAGSIANAFGFNSIYLFAAIMSLAGLLLCLYLFKQAQRAMETPNARQDRPS